MNEHENYLRSIVVGCVVPKMGQMLDGELVKNLIDELTTHLMEMVELEHVD